AEDFALRDRAVEQALLSGRGAGDDGAGAAVRVLPAPRWRRGFPHFRGNDSRAAVLPAGASVLAPRRDQRLAAAVRGGVSRVRLRRGGGADAVVARAALEMKIPAEAGIRRGLRAAAV